MDLNIKTLELARLYESQGHIKEAHDIYADLNEQSASGETAAGLKRMKARLEKMKTENPVSYPDLVIDSDLIDDSVLESMNQSRKDQLETHSKKLDTRSDIQRMLDLWLTLIVLEDRLNTLEEL